MFSPVFPSTSIAAADAPTPSTPRSQTPAAKDAATGADTHEAVLQALLLAIRQADPAVPDLVRAELDIDKATRRVVARVVSQIDGQVVRQYPPEETLRLLARARELFGRLVETRA
ncbi:MAG: flagellar protein FlaG [Rhodospirillaceae bacterium]|nr:flagellar protein FlaG [Rhodospirillaceae bacterium]